MTETTPETLGSLESAHISSPQHLHTLKPGLEVGKQTQRQCLRGHPPEPALSASSYQVHHDLPSTPNPTPSHIKRQARWVGQSICQPPFPTLQELSGHLKLTSAFQGTKAPWVM